MKRLSDDEKARLQAKIEQERTESLSDSPVSNDVEEPTSVASTDIAKANKRIKHAWIAGLISGILFPLGVLGGIDAIQTFWLLIGLTYGIYKKSRVCAVIMFVYFVGGKLILKLVESVKAGLGAHELGYSLGTVLPWAIFGYFFFQGIRGTFAYHTLEPTAKKLKAKTVLLVLGCVFSIIVVFLLFPYFSDEAMKRKNLEYVYYEHGNRVVSEKLIAQIDASSWIGESLRVSPDNRRVAYVAGVGGKPLVVVDGKEGKIYDSISIGAGTPIFSPDSRRVAYVAKAGDKSLVVVDGKEEKQYDGIMEGTPIFSPDSQRVAYAAGIGDKWLVVVDGKEGKEYDGIVNGASIIFDSPDSLHYLVGKGKSIYLVEERIK